MFNQSTFFFFFFFFFSFAGDYTGTPVKVMNEAVLRRSPMVPYSLLCIVVASRVSSRQLNRQVIGSLRQVNHGVNHNYQGDYRKVGTQNEIESLR